MMSFARRCSRRETIVAHVRAWRSDDHRFVLEEHRYEVSLPPAWFALVLDGSDYRLLSRHRRRGAAVRACERHARKFQRKAG